MEAPSKEEDSVKESGHSPEDEWEELEVAVSVGRLHCQWYFSLMVGKDVRNRLFDSHSHGVRPLPFVQDPLLSLGDSPSAPLFSAAVCWTGIYS